MCYSQESTNLRALRAPPAGTFKFLRQVVVYPKATVILWQVKKVECLRSGEKSENFALDSNPHWINGQHLILSNWFAGISSQMYQIYKMLLSVVAILIKFHLVKQQSILKMICFWPS